MPNQKEQAGERIDLNDPIVATGTRRIPRFFPTKIFCYRLTVSYQLGERSPMTTEGHSPVIKLV
jgi:hypothetical protein